MNLDEVIRSVNQTLVTGFEIEPEQIKPETKLFEDLGLDSLDAVDMLVFIEDELGIAMDAELFKGVRTVQQVYDAVAAIVAAGPVSRPAPSPEVQV